MFFQKGVNIAAALAQMTAASQTVLKLAAAGNHAALRAELQRLKRARHPARAVEQEAAAEQLFDLGQNFIRPQLAQVAGARRFPRPTEVKSSRCRSTSIRKLQAYGLSAEDVVNAIGRQNIVLPVGNEKVGDREYVVALNGSPARLDKINDLPIRRSTGRPSTFATSPMCIRAHRRRPTWSASTARARC